ncbi:sialin-like [Lethenteron reissneri]|uniref:sialin-like n=1 Tax=Lethenteron reissneri TaxID=7753 RepID=UPI002AB69D8F|nr:sialin-like [Lethenteron reissneri]
MSGTRRAERAGTLDREDLAGTWHVEKELSWRHEWAGRRCSCRSRHVLAALGFVGLALVYALRVNLSVAMVAMVNSTGAAHRDSNSSAYCPLPVPSNGSRPAQLPSVAVYNWDSKIQGWILSSFFYGYIITQVPGGYLAARYGGKLLFGVGVMVTTLLTLLTPLAADLGVPWIIVVRVLEGIGEGVTYPTMHAMWALWAPPYERSTLISICYSGGHFGTVVTMPLSGMIAETLGWPAIFYIFWGMGLLWSFFWYYFAFSSPDSHPRISLAEREYIQTTLRAERQAVEKSFSSVPWLRIALSAPVWALSVAMFCSSWAFYTIFTSMPTFMSTVLHFDLQENGQLSALPYLAGWLCTLLGGWAADAILRRKLLSTTATRKSLTFLGLAAPGAFLVGAAFVGCDHVLAVCFLTFAVGTSSFATAGCWVNQLDIAPQSAAVLLGISNTISNLPGFLAPVATGYLTEHNTLMEWQVVFYLSAAISLFGALFYVAFGSGEQQSWAWEAEPEVGASPGLSFLTETSLTIKGLDPPVTS